MRINLHFELAPGDCWALIPLLRDFAEQQPAHELCPVTPSNEVFAGLPFYRAPRPKPDLDLRFRFTPDRVSDGCAFYGTDGVSTMPGVAPPVAPSPPVSETPHDASKSTGRETAATIQAPNTDRRRRISTGSPSRNCSRVYE